MQFEWDPKKAKVNLKKQNMRDKAPKRKVDELRPEYGFDYSKAARGKYCRRLLEEGSNVVILDHVRHWVVPDELIEFSSNYI
jgi:hypothetical protein